ncbi:Engulfment/cell motility, ELMO domain-containing protein [Strongyloides ratti]|uniref:Engulfment/cell motility, ELMO domain-containing protein n=1 Tax=Strongyloides ratti TaxID=34506 RepID=A0A090L305_STRRB|nr:Engulfment/cell motility, ELMO domain-containing protein [Strongyloides ratti]CEF61854.1 Engulfment/cell motility, ELMO domain-containing protein [Strongyloides ratti]
MPILLIEEPDEPFIQWISRIFYETLRCILTDSKVNKAITTVRVEEYFKNCDSKTFKLLEWESGDESDEASKFLEKDDEIVEIDDDIKDKLKFSMKQIKAYHFLICLVESWRAKKYDSENKEHEAKLYELWSLLKKNEKLKSRKSKQWEDIGFQGTDPATDFRGMGLLGLEQLIYFAKNDLDNCLKILQLSQHPTKGFPFAICSITISFIAKELLINGHLKKHFYNNNINLENVSIEDFHKTYMSLFKLFSNHWFFGNGLRDIMNFNVIKDEWTSIIEKFCSCDSANLLNLTTMQDIL